jgi:tetratricopeptide (TPR) repeat protein
MALEIKVLGPQDAGVLQHVRLIDSAEDVAVSRGFRALVLALLLTASAALAGAVIWWSEAREGRLQYVLGVGFLALGLVFTTLQLTLSDDFLRRHFGEPSAGQMRRAWRGGWVGILLGGAMLGVLYLDRWVQATAAEAQSKAAYNRGLSAAKTGDWQAAVDAFSEAIRLDPNSARAYRNRGVAFLHQGEDDRALEDLGAAIRLDPNDANTFYNRGVTYCRKGDLARALADFTEAIRLNPGYAKAYLARSKVHDRKGDHEQAKADRQKAAELDPALDDTETVPL